MGAVTVSIKRTVYTSAGKMITADVTFSGTYGAGGDTYTESLFGCKTIDAIIDAGTTASTTTGFVLAPDLTGKKLRLLGGAASGIALAESAVGGQTGTVSRVLVLADQPYV
jgi:hypothetical protein